MKQTLVFFYTYRMGGWGDMVKGLHTCWCWAKATKRELRIDFRHHIFGKLFPQYTDTTLPPITSLTLNAIDQVGKISVERLQEFSDKNEIIIACNWFSVESIGSVDPFPFYKELYTDFFPVPAIEIPKDYHVLHCRVGDKYLSEATSCKSDDRIKSFSRLPTIIEQYNALKHPKTLVCSDSAIIIDKLLKAIPNSFSICPRPYHIAYPHAEIYSKLEDILLMIQEHKAMTESAGIYMMSYSGFPITAGLVGGISLQLWNEECTLFWYSDTMVNDIRKLSLKMNRA